MEIVVCSVFKEKCGACILVFLTEAQYLSFDISLLFLHVLLHAYVSSGLDGQI